MSGSRDWRELRSLRHDPPGYANRSGARRTTFQAALEQCEQFIKAAAGADYATRPVQLFYALSQGGRAVVAASPRTGQDWRVTGHGLSTDTNSTSLPDVTVYASGSGMFQAMATALGFEPLVQEDKVRLGALWPLIPETIDAPLTKDETLSALLFWPSSWPQSGPYWSAEVNWIRPHVGVEFGEGKRDAARFFKQYPAFSDINWSANGGFQFRDDGRSLTTDLLWELGDSQRPPVMEPGSRLLVGGQTSGAGAGHCRS